MSCIMLIKICGPHCSVAQCSWVLDNSKPDRKAMFVETEGPFLDIMASLMLAMSLNMNALLSFVCHSKCQIAAAASGQGNIMSARSSWKQWKHNKQAGLVRRRRLLRLFVLRIGGRFCTKFRVYICECTCICTFEYMWSSSIHMHAACDCESLSPLTLIIASMNLQKLSSQVYRMLYSIFVEFGIAHVFRWSRTRTRVRA